MAHHPSRSTPNRRRTTRGTGDTVGHPERPNRLSVVRRNRWLLLAGATVVWLAGLAWRGGIGERGSVVYVADAAFHYRLVEHLLESGRPLATDPLFVQAEPRVPFRDMYPPAFHYLAAGWARLAGWAGASRESALYVLCALLGSLAVPLTGWLAWRAAKRADVTVSAMLLAAAATPLVTRGAYGILRPEPFGATLVVLAALLVADWTVHWPRGRQAAWLAAAALVHALGVGTWRLFPALAALGIGAAVASDWLAARRPGRMPVLLAGIAGTATAGVACDFYRTGAPDHLLFLLPALLPTFVHLALASGRAHAFGERLGKTRRWAGLGAAAALLVAAGFAVVPVLRVRAIGWLGTGGVPLNEANLYGRIVNELQPLDLLAAFAPERWFYLPAALAALTAVWIWRRAALPGDPFLIVAGAGYGLAALLFVRFEYVAAPFGLALLAVALRDALAAILPARWGRGWVSVGLLAALLPAVVAYARLDGHLADPPTRQEMNRRKTYAWLREHLAIHGAIAASWSLGFELQTYTGRPTLTDGFLESSLNRERLLAFYRALYGEDEERLAAFCRRHGARWLVLDRSHLLPVARTLELPWREWVDVAEGPDQTLQVTIRPAGLRLVHVRLLGGQPTRCFHPVYDAGNYLVLELRDVAGG
ncbi:MAG TPA: hypothetical protein PLY66_09660 [Acidobacteriota bacterium]|nr:hypothetical protein [Acidobacteriota bacterium]HQF86760.1 hypothetical protein [Acidobacteriota bacterium]HQG91442.1 hypothetical protein [Acidobacteriota bacterium]HQK88204.1 hypothetical protein [Acidobacteriota bacterium]